MIRPKIGIVARHRCNRALIYAQILSKPPPADGSLHDLELTVKFKAVSGEVDQAAGLVFHLKDANNYYIVRANAREDNYRLYRVVAGRRRVFAEANLEVTSGQWHELRVTGIGTKSSVTTMA